MIRPNQVNDREQASIKTSIVQRIHKSARPSVPDGCKSFQFSAQSEYEFRHKSESSEKKRDPFGGKQEARVLQVILSGANRERDVAVLHVGVDVPAGLPDGVPADIASDSPAFTAPAFPAAAAADRHPCPLDVPGIHALQCAPSGHA